MGYISSNIFVCLKMGFVPQHCCSESGKLRTCDEEQLSNGFSSTLRNFQSNPYYPIVIQWGFQQQQRWIKPDIPGKAGYRTDGNAAEWSAPKEFQAVRCQDHVSIVQSRATCAIEIERWQKQTLDLPFFHEQELNTYSQSKISVFGGGFCISWDQCNRFSFIYSFAVLRSCQGDSQKGGEGSCHGGCGCTFHSSVSMCQHPMRGLGLVLLSLWFLCDFGVSRLATGILWRLQRLQSLLHQVHFKDGRMRQFGGMVIRA
jgi:hypothetical protein